MIFILGVLILNVCCAANTLAIDFFLHLIDTFNFHPYQNLQPAPNQFSCTQPVLQCL